jgi:hypothetical protein
LIRGEPTSITSQVAIDDRLKLLAAQFEKFANAKEIEAVPTTFQEIQDGDEVKELDSESNQETGSPT